MSKRSFKSTLNGSSTQSSNGTKSKSSKIIALRDISDHSIQTRSAIDVSEPLFEPIPEEVTFHDYEPFTELKVTISLRNKDLVARRVQLEPPASHFFSLSPPLRGQKASSKVAPGMELQYTLTFRPESTNDYNCDLVCSTEREQFVIPVRARGARPKLDYPEKIEFGTAPVNFSTERQLLLRNYGPRDTAFALQMNGPFGVKPAAGFIPVNQTATITVTFDPQAQGHFVEQMQILLDSDVRMVATLSGEAQSVDVRLASDQLECAPTYIHLSSQQTVVLRNHSDSPVTFNWRNCATREEESHVREQMLVQLAEEEEQARDNIEAFIASMSADEFDADGSEPNDDDEEDERNAYRRQKAEQAIAHKFRQLRLELEERSLAFNNENFSLEPLSGEIWPLGEKEITVTFKPEAVIKYDLPAYCDVTGCAERLPLNLMGQGVGPRANFSYETLDIGEVYINAVHRYEVTLQNVGEIKAGYKLSSSSSRFTFSPEQGSLHAGEHGDEGEEVTIKIVFTSDQIGEFVEVLEWHLQGTVEPLLLTFKGNVIGPTFYFDEKELDFGLVSYGFLNTQNLTLHNTSEIPMRYSLRIPEDGQYMSREFNITPGNGQIFPREKADIKVEFISETVKRYEGYLIAIDIQGVGSELMTIPISAECQVSDVLIGTEVLDFGEVFLRHPTTVPIPVANPSENLHAKFVMQTQDEASREIATIQPERPTAAIPPMENHDLNVTLTAHRLGSVSLPVYIKVPGIGSLPKTVTCKANVVGPNVLLERDHLDFGNREVHRPEGLTFRMSNDSPIPADFKAFLHKKGSCFSLDVTHGRLEAHQSMEITVICTLHDTGKIQDTLHILIHEGAELAVKLSAKGVGTAILASTNLEVIDHGNQFTNNITTSTFRLENRGHRAHTLVWNYIPKEEEDDPKAAARRQKNKKDDAELPNSIFAVVPRKIVLEPMMAMDFTVQGLATSAGEVSEQWICGALIGKDAKEFVDIYTTRVRATFIDPLIEFSRTEISFQQMNDPKNPVAPKAERVDIKNVSKLPLNFSLKVPHPFTSDRVEYELQPGDSATTNIHFVAEENGADRQSTKIKNHMIVQYRDHPQRDKLALFGDICFPNLTFESTKLDFGCILNETVKRMTKKITNNSSIEVEYEWVFYEDADSAASTSVNQIFDILPIRGVLSPGDSEDVEFVFYGNIDSKVKASAVCEVVGGPEYEISLAGECSMVSYKLDRTEMDFGAKDMNSVDEKEITLHNTGRVAFAWSVDTMELNESVVTVSPLEGSLSAGEKQKLTVHLNTRLPARIHETFSLIIAYFDPIPIVVNAIGVFPCANFTLPRDNTEKWNELVQRAEVVLEEQKQQAQEGEIVYDPSATARTNISTSRPPKYEPPTLPQYLRNYNPKVDAHLEADRLCYFEHAAELLAVEQAEIKAGRKTPKPRGPTGKSDHFVISHYLCDFGNIILGQSKKISFKVCNVSASPISFDLVKRAFAGTIFAIEPMQVVRLPPGQSVEFNVQCVTNPRKNKQELTLINVPVVVKGGPELRLCLRANITVPTLEISETKLDFGSVFAGQRHEITVQLHNTKEVPCEWNFKSIIASSQEHGKARDKDSWEVLPSSGVLPPDGRENIVIAFQPTEKKKMTAKIPLKINMNPKGQFINCKGSGLSVGVDFEPADVSLGPVLPYQTSEPYEVKIVNTCGRDIELYSLDFDQQYLEEEEILRGDETYQNGVIYAKPRQPGEGLPKRIIKAHKRRLKKQERDEAEAAARAEREAAAEAAAAAAAAAAENGEATPDVPVEVAAEQVGEVMAVVDDDDLSSVGDRVVNLLVTGGPFAGVSTLAKSVSTQLGVEVVNSFDDVVQWLLDLEEAAGQFRMEEAEAARIRESGSKKEKEALAAKEAEQGEPPVFSEEQLACAASIKAAIEAFRAEGSAVDERSASQKGKRSGKASARKPESSSPLADLAGHNVLSEELLAEALRVFVLQPRFAPGIVFDGLDCHFAEPDSLARVIKATFQDLSPRENNLHIINLSVDRPAALDRLNSMREHYTAVMEDKEAAGLLKKFKLLTDKEVAKLTGDKLTKYEEVLVVYNQRQEATVVLDKLDHSMERINSFYGISEPAEETPEEPAEAEAANAGPTAHAAQISPHLAFHTILQMFDMSHPWMVQETVMDAEAEVVHKWVKAKSLAPCDLEQADTKAMAYIREVFYVEEDPSLTDPSWVPPPQLHQLLYYPEPRRPRAPATNFYFVDRTEVVPEVKQPADDEKAAPPVKGAAKKGGKSAEDATPAAEEEAPPADPVVKFMRSSKTRWTIPAKGFVSVYVQFMSETTGRFSHNLAFEIVGSQNTYELSAKGVCSVPEIAGDPRSIFMRRVKTRKNNPIVHRQWVTSDKVFDFGPLLVGKEPTSRLLPPTEEDKKIAKAAKTKKVLSAVRKVNAETFRITNTGMFDLQCDFSFRDATTSIVQALEDDGAKGGKDKAAAKGKDKGKDAKKGKGKGKEEAKDASAPLNDPNQPIFIVEPPSLLIPTEEMREVTVWSFPQDCGTFDDVLVCSVKDNPRVIQLPVRCYGAKPTVELNLSEVSFERLMIGQSESRNIEITNVSPIPVAWSLTGLEELGDELTISPVTSGILPALETTTFTVTFKAIEQNIFNYTIPLEIRDTENILGLVSTKPITINAEAFKMDVVVDVPEHGLDFETLRVNEAATREFTITNSGKYNVKYNFSTATKSQQLFSEIFSIEPDQGELLPGQEQLITVTAKTSSEENIKNSDLKLHLIEGGTDEVVRSVAVAISLRSVFSQFRLLPVHGVNFGPLEMGITKTKKITICNDGEFEFQFRLFPASDRDKYPEPLGAPEPDEPAGAAKGKGAKKPDKKKEKKSARGKGGGSEGEAVVSGPFTISPTEGFIPPGSTLDISVTMEATETNSYVEVLEVDISQREFKHPGGHMADANRLTLDLSGESCSPGVDTTGWESIFEEQAVMSKISGRVVDKNFFALEERAFVFAPVIANQNQGVRAERFRISNPFKVPCNVQLRVYMQGDGGKESARGAKKPPAKKPAGKGGKDEGGGSSDGSPFKLDPPALHIPNHEHRYVTVSFNPTALQAYTAVFEAVVDKGSDPATKTLTFELRGEGTLPHLTISEPSARTEEGMPLLQFDRLFCHPTLSRSQTRAIALYNPGIVPATCRFDMSSTDHFSFSGLGKMFTVDPGTEHKLDVTFHPKKPEEHDLELKMSVLQNPFEVSVFKLQGAGYLEDVALETGTVATAEIMGDELCFGDVPVDNVVSKTVTLVNYSDSPYKFAWQLFSATSAPDGKGGAAKGAAKPKKGGKDEGEVVETPDFVLFPAIGHLQPHSSKTVTVTFTSSAPRQHEKVPIRCELTQIQYLTMEERKAKRDANKAAGSKAKGKPAKGKGKEEPEEATPEEEPPLEEYDLKNMDWDESMKVSRWVMEEPAEEEAKKDKKTPRGSPDSAAEPRLVEVVETVEEPEYKEMEAKLDGSNSQATKELGMRMSVTCDKAVYECAVKNVNFRPTMMFQTREFKFPIKNTSAINLNYKWRVVSFSHSVRADDTEMANPFSISGMAGTILPGQEDIFSLKFSPLDALTYKSELVCDIENLPADCERPCIQLFGQGNRPKCHFELVNSDYITANRRQIGLPGPDGNTGPLDPAYRVIEFKSLGTKVRNTRRFFVVNPTNISYSFEWKCEDQSGSSANPFRCQTMSGIVESGRKFEMIFEFVPERDQLVESFWRFTILNHDINIPILLTGTVAEPEVKLDRSRVKFEASMLGRRVIEKVNLLNTEHIPFHFSIDKSTIKSGGIEVSPLSGVVGPEGSMPITLTFLPTREQEYNWNVLFNIRNKPGRVALNIKGEGYAIKSNVTLKEEKESNIQRNLYTDEVNRVDFGAVHIYERRVKSVVIANEGKFTFNYTWKMAQNRFITISPMTGSVRAGSKAEVDISYYTSSEAAVDNLVATCLIANSNSSKYVVNISGRGKKPSLDFSFKQHDFGRCFMVTAPQSSHLGGSKVCAATEKILTITNHETDQNVALDMLYDSAPFLSIPATSCVMAPGESIQIPVKFSPFENRKYRQMVPFEINGLYKINVLFTGEGTPLKLELQDPGQEAVSFGQVRVGSVSTRAVNLVNHSKKTVSFTLNKPQRQTGQLLDKFLKVFPPLGQEVSLRSKDSMRIELVFEPGQRMSPFTGEIFLETVGTARRLLLISGQCHGLGMRLESDKCPFGNVIEHSSLTKKVQLSNTGDVGTNFKWQEVYKPHFTIDPSEGFLPAGGNVTMEVTFHPAFLSPDIRFEKVACLVDGQLANDMYLTLSGGCVPQPTEAVEELRFITKVRQTETQTITLSNPTDKPWTLRPSIQNDCWQGDPSVEVPANGEATYTISFKPLTMTKEPTDDAILSDDKKSAKKPAKDSAKRPVSKQSAKRPASKGSDVVTARDLGDSANRPAQHTGSLFFPLPNGKAINYSLVGFASFPDPEGRIEVTVPAKKRHTEALSVKNWINDYQRFKVIFTPEIEDPSVTLMGSDTLDVPAMAERKYKLNFFAFKEGVTNASIQFLNESTGESISYTLVFNVTSADVFDDIPPLVTAIRQKLVYEVAIDNPLDTEAVISDFKCEEGSVFIATPITIPPRSAGVVPVQFRPLVAFQSTKTQLTLPCSTLGDFKYTLDLSCSAHVAEKSLRFNVNLGVESRLTYRFISYSTVPVEYECSVTGNQFLLDTTKVSAPAAAPGSDGVEVTVDIRYEPSAIGSMRDTFTATHPTAGTFTCLLMGTCEQPKPQGPIAIAAGQTANVKFKNVLDTAETFVFSVDNPAFMLGKKTEKLNAKAVVTLAVQFKPDDGAAAGGAKGKGKEDGGKPSTQAAVAMGKLIVSSPSSPELTWVYYLQGAKD